MADKLNPEVEIVLDKPRRLKFGFRAMRAFERETGKNILKSGAIEMNATDITVLLWACLIDEDRALTLEAAIDLIDKYGSLTEIAAKLKEAQEAAMPDAAKAEGEGEGETPLARRPAGSKSGATRG